VTGQRHAKEAAGAEGATEARLSRRGFLAGGAAVGVAVVPLVDSTLAGATQKSRTPADKHHKHKVKVKFRPSPTALPAPGAIYAAHADPADLGLLQAASLLQAGLLSSRELTAACQSRIAKRNGPVSFAGSPATINAWIRLYAGLAGQLAAEADATLARARRRSGAAPLLCGVPLGLKDLYAVDGLPVTASSRVLEGNIAKGDSAAWRRLAAAGMVLLGHTHTDEFAFLAVTPQCGNPWNPALITGGSSGGSAAALAARMVPAAMRSGLCESRRRSAE
jgi:aspartyl-tRNA(Asn)/glutamyl-tRNA(Gln) amidotransferase subunit A